MLPNKLIDLFRLKLKFATSSAVATVVDYSIYLILIHFGLTPVKANLMSAGTGMVINFLLQKNYIFNLNRQLRTAMLISLLSSLVGISLSTFLIHNLSQVAFFSEYQMITKALVTGVVFFYNFYMKRFAFERKML